MMKEEEKSDRGQMDGMLKSETRKKSHFEDMKNLDISY